MRMIPRPAFLLALSVCLAVCPAIFLAGCHAVPGAGYETQRPVPADAHPAPFAFSNYKLDLAPGADIGVTSDGARFCGWPHEVVGRTYLRDRLRDELLRHAFIETLESQGYDVVGNREIMFDEEDEDARAEYGVAARITKVSLNACEQSPGVLLWLITSRSGIQGALYLEVDWTVYSYLDRKVVYRARTAGTGKRTIPNSEGIALLAADAFEIAAHNLGADEGFHQLMVAGKRPERLSDRERHEDRPRLFDPQEEVLLPAQALSTVPFEKQAGTLRRNALLIRMPQGHGSGFFITREGHILTNQHVTGNARTVRVELPGYPRALTAEVLRTDRRRDAALLKLTAKPDDLVIDPAPLRLDWPAVSEPVFAVGAPRLRHLDNSVTKGIISAHRRAFIGSRRQNRLQSDVEIHGGNSGGPLFDAHGNIVAIAAEGYGEPGIGLNLFIPIDEALRDLGITIAAPPEK